MCWVMSASLLTWSGSVVSRGGIYRLAQWKNLFCDRCTRIHCASVSRLFRCCGIQIRVYDIVSLTWVISPPHCL